MRRHESFNRMTHRLRHFLPTAAAIFLLAILVLASACGGTQANVVNIRDLRFNPPELTVTKGTTVTWTNNDQTAHTVTSDSFDNTSAPVAQQWTSKPLNPGQSFSHTFDEPGSYPYHCEIHAYLKGKIIVR